MKRSCQRNLIFIANFLSILVEKGAGKNRWVFKNKNLTTNTFKRVTNLAVFACVIAMSSSCASFAKRLDANKDLVADTGELTRYELEKSAIIFSQKIIEHFEKKPVENGIFLAFLPTKNETSESLPVQVFDNIIVQELRKKGIFTIAVKNRQATLKEFEFSQSGLSDGNLSVGNLKSPNFFIRSEINENIFRHGGDKIVEQIINLELSEIETLIIHWSDKITYRKKAVSASKISW